MKAQCLIVLIIACAVVAVASSCGICAVSRLQVDISVRNGSRGDIRGVTLRDGKHSVAFGYLSSGGVGKTVAGVEVMFGRDVGIVWDERGTSRRTGLGLERYREPASRIRGLWLTYLGDDHWDVVARDGIHADSAVITP